MAAVAENAPLPVTNENTAPPAVAAEEKTEKTNGDAVTVFHDPENFNVKHPLMHEWTLWFTKPPSGKGDNWNDLLKEVVTFNSVEEFWGIYNNITPTSELGLKADYHLFKKGVRPEWEDPQNKHGGKWSFSFKDKRSVPIDDLWLHAQLAAIGETLENDGDQEVMGVVAKTQAESGRLHRLKMFSRSALARAFALPLEQAARPSLTASTTFRACLHQATTTTSSSNTHPDEPLSAAPRAQSSTPIQQQTPTTTTTTTRTPLTRADVPLSKQPIAPTFTRPLTVTKSLLETLPHLANQKPHYISAHLHDRPYLITEGDHLRLPFLMPNVQTGDVLRFNRASILGSRDFTLKGTPYVDERLFECRVRVMGVDSEPLRVKEKTKRRRRHVQKVTSKHRYTLLRVMEVKVKSVEELQKEGEIVVEDKE